MKLTPEEKAKERYLHKYRILHPHCKWNFALGRQEKLGFTPHGVKLPKLPPNVYVAFRTYRRVTKRRRT